MRTMLRLLVLCLIAGIHQPVAAETEVSLELVLLADATGSIDDDEILFQRQGYAKAITDPAVVSAIQNTPHGKIAVSYVEWGDSHSQEVVVGWTVIDGAETADQFAKALVIPPRLASGRNAIGTALLFGKAMIETNDISGFRRVIDFSADSANNFSGPSIEEARDIVLAAGITINGLAVLCRHCLTGRPGGYDLEQAFADRIVGGPGAFVVTADSAATFADAVRKKLILEIAGRRPPTRYSQATHSAAPHRPAAP